MEPNFRSIDEFSAHLTELGAQVAEPTQGFFGPDSLSWTINEEALLLLGGMRALLMQIAHPKVAQAVADHSRFREEPFKRLVRTFRAVHAIVFGTRDEAIAAALQVYTVHERVRGTLSDRAPAPIDSEYYANDPELLAWVFTTLMDSAVVTYELFFADLTQSQQEQAYEEGKRFAQLFGIATAQLPATWAQFKIWSQDTINSDALSVTPTAQEIAKSLLSGSLLLWMFKPLNTALAAGMLDPRLRDAFGLSWHPMTRHGFKLAVNSIRLLARVTPRTLRILPIARHARRRCARSG